MRLNTIAFLILTLITTSSNSWAETVDLKYDAGTLYSACKPIAGQTSINLADAELFLAGLCLGTVTAIQHQTTFNCLFGTFNSSDRRADASEASYTAAVQAFVNYAKDRPQEWNKLGSDVVADALAEYFPCKR